MSTLAAAISSGKAIFDLVKLIDGARLDNAGQEAVRTLNSTLLSHQSNMLGLSEKLQEQQNKINSLEKSLDVQEKWKEIAQSYYLNEVIDDVFVYYYAGPEGNGHNACPICFEKQFRSVIQKGNWSHAGQQYVCHHSGCNFQYLDESKAKEFTPR
jgi:hypothetical protein